MILPSSTLSGDGWMNQEELALKIQNGDLTTRRNVQVILSDLSYVLRGILTFT